MSYPGDVIEEGEGGAVDPVVRVGVLHGLEQVTHVTHVDARLTHGVRLLHNLDR